MKQDWIVIPYYGSVASFSRNFLDELQMEQNLSLIIQPYNPTAVQFMKFTSV
jgi:hypothetical protein